MVRNSHRDVRQVALSVISSPYQLDGYMVLGKCLTNTIFNLISEQKGICLVQFHLVVEALFNNHSES